MRVKIIKANEDIYWYAKHIGEEFEVEEGTDEDSYLVIDSNVGVDYYIGKNDCEIIEENKMVNEKSWSEFRNNGLLWFINSILHMFGWAIVLDIDNKEVVKAYPARVKFRGFNDDTNTQGYIKVSQYLKDNIDELLKESME